jgi:hypothetical protein
MLPTSILGKKDRKKVPRQSTPSRKQIQRWRETLSRSAESILLVPGRDPAPQALAVILLQTLYWPLLAWGVAPAASRTVNQIFVRTCALGVQPRNGWGEGRRRRPMNMNLCLRVASICAKCLQRVAFRSGPCPEILICPCRRPLYWMNYPTLQYNSAGM